MSKPKFNHDIFPGEEFTKAFPSLSWILSADVEGEAFRKHDALAKSHKFWWYTLGRTSLFLTVVVLLAIVGELVVYALGLKPPAEITATIEITALIAVLLLVIDHFLHNKPFYLYHCFCRERIRHFRFQAFLDGGLLTLGTTDPDAAKTQLEGRLQHKLLADLDSGEGALESFVARTSSESQLLHPLVKYEDADIGMNVFEALDALRFRHQAQYPRRKTAVASVDRSLSMMDQYHWAEVVGKVMLASALILPATQVTLLALDFSGAWPPPKWLTILLFGASIGAAIVSAGARAYCVGLTLPDEVDSYAQYVARIDHLQDMATKSKSLKEKQACLLELELEAERELRRFLQMKMKASFIA